jgi:hypothetical protein
LSALVIALEVADFTRVQRAVQLGSWLGLVPSRQQSGESDRHGSISNTGSKYARRILVEAARHPIPGPSGGQELLYRLYAAIAGHFGGAQLMVASAVAEDLPPMHRRSVATSAPSVIDTGERDHPTPSGWFGLRPDRVAPLRSAAAGGSCSAMTATRSQVNAVRQLKAWSAARPTRTGRKQTPRRSLHA